MDLGEGGRKAWLVPGLGHPKSSEGCFGGSGRISCPSCTFLFLKIFSMWTILKVFIESITILLLFYALAIFFLFFFLAVRHVGS